MLSRRTSVPAVAALPAIANIVRSLPPSDPLPIAMGPRHGPWCGIRIAGDDYACGAITMRTYGTSGRFGNYFRTVPRWVAEGKLKQEDAEQRLRALQHAYDLLVKCHYDHPAKV